MDALQMLKDFAGAVEQAIGTEETATFLTAVTKFAKECPDALQEIKELVENNPDVFGNLLTREGVNDAKEMIAQVAQMAPMFSAFR